MHLSKRVKSKVCNFAAVCVLVSISRLSACCDFILMTSANPVSDDTRTVTKMVSKKSLIHLLLLGVITLALPGTSHAGVAVGISVRIGPPVLPVYVQPPCPEPGYIWTPGYWAYGPDGYYWVPGAWVEPPAVGVLWTPGYWGWSEGFYVWHGGYWGPHVGFYGGINYGFGYTGVGFVGGYWEGREYRYNRAVTNVNVTVIHNTYINNTVINNRNVTRVSYNGGSGGVRAMPSAQERNWEHERHFEATSAQSHHQELARGNRDQLYSANHGNPHIAASPKAGVFEGRGVQGTRNFNRAANNNAAGNVNRGGNNNASRDFNRGGNNNASGNFNRTGNNRASTDFNRGGNNNPSRDFNRNNNLSRSNTNNSGFKGNGAQGGNRNFDRNARNNNYGSAPRGNNNAVVNNHPNNAHPNNSRESGGRSDQHANNTHGDKGDKGDKHDHR